jgi:hypothetical protein
MKLNNNKLCCGVLVCAVSWSLPTQTSAYPLDGYTDTGIRRLEAARLIEEGAQAAPWRTTANRTGRPASA